MLRTEVKKIIDELNGPTLSANTEDLIKRILVASVVVYEDPDLAACGAEYTFEEALSNKDYPITLED